MRLVWVWVWVWDRIVRGKRGLGNQSRRRRPRVCGGCRYGYLLSSSSLSWMSDICTSSSSSSSSEIVVVRFLPRVAFVAAVVVFFVAAAPRPRVDLVVVVFAARPPLAPRASSCACSTRALQRYCCCLADSRPHCRLRLHRPSPLNPF